MSLNNHLIEYHIPYSVDTFTQFINLDKTGSISVWQIDLSVHLHQSFLKIQIIPISHLASFLDTNVAHTNPNTIPSCCAHSDYNKHPLCF